MNIRVADIQSRYELWKSSWATFLTEPIPKYGEIRCYIRDPDGYIIEVGESTGQAYGYGSADPLTSRLRERQADVRRSLDDSTNISSRVRRRSVRYPPLVQRNPSVQRFLRNLK